jgi:hypothetical protein
MRIGPQVPSLPGRAIQAFRVQPLGCGCPGRKLKLELYPPEFALSTSN